MDSSVDAAASGSGAVAQDLHQRCWRAWWSEPTRVERSWWRTSVKGPYLSREQVERLQMEGLPLTTVAGPGDGAPVVLLPLDLAELVEQDAQPA